MKRFDINMEYGLIKILRDMLPEPDETSLVSESRAAAMKKCIVMCPSNIMMVVAKSEEAKRVLSRFLDKRQLGHKYPDLNYKSIIGEVIKSKYNLEFLKDIWNLFDQMDIGMEIQINGEYPATFSNEHFEVILAPRVDNI